MQPISNLIGLYRSNDERLCLINVFVRGRMSHRKNWPKVGQELVHKFRAKRGQVTARVLKSDEAAGKVTVRVGKKTYSSLSAAAKGCSGYIDNGWTYWGLKKQRAYKRRERSSGRVVRKAKGK